MKFLVTQFWQKKTEYASFKFHRNISDTLKTMVYDKKFKVTVPWWGIVEKETSANSFIKEEGRVPWNEHDRGGIEEGKRETNWLGS